MDFYTFPKTLVKKITLTVLFVFTLTIIFANKKSGNTQGDILSILTDNVVYGDVIPGGLGEGTGEGTSGGYSGDGGEGGEGCEGEGEGGCH